MRSRPREQGSLPPREPGSPSPQASTQDSRSAVGDELLQLGQVHLPLHRLGLRQRTHVQSDDVFGQHLGQRGPWVSWQALLSLGPHRGPAGREGAYRTRTNGKREACSSGLSAAKTQARSRQGLLCHQREQLPENKPPHGEQSSRQEP